MRDFQKKRSKGKSKDQVLESIQSSSTPDPRTKHIRKHNTQERPGRIAQSVTCLATDVCLTADPGVASSIPARSHTVMEIDHKIISMTILLPSADHSRMVVVSYKRKYVHELLVKHFFKPAQEKVW